MWGALAGDIYRSADQGATWTAYCNSWPGVGEEAFLARIVKTSDGEVLVLSDHEIRKSSGWASGNAATWSAKKVPNNGSGIFNGFGLDGNGTKFVLVEYAPTPASWSESRYGYISIDSGTTWTMRYDTLALWGSAANAASHLHAACYDPWNDTFYIGEGHGPAGGVYHSTKDGMTWAVAPGMRLPEPGGNYNAPTVITATDDGLVMGSDNSHNGLFGVVRQANPMDQVATHTWTMHTGRDGLVTFAQRGWRDPETGLVYVTFRAEYDDTRPSIAAGTAGSGGLVYEWPTLPSVAGADRFYFAARTTPSTLTAYAEMSGVPTTVRGHLAFTSSDVGNMRGGSATAPSAVAAGPGAKATAATSIALGKAASAGSADGTAIGANSSVTATAGTAIGASAAAGNGGVAVGNRATSAAANSVAVGLLAEASANGSVAVGSQSKSSAPTSVAVGELASTSGTEATAVGAGATVTAGAGTAIGRLARAGNAGTALGRGALSDSGVALGFGATTGTHNDSVALGILTAATAPSQVQAGARHFEIAELSAAPTAGAANTVRFYAKDNGAGKTQLCVKFSNGVEIVLATQA
ncbi:hypothetical protein [Pseudarthrobacter sp. Y6]|uniref:hypothetical protein n=1 Tax=Pseudarthrobacter sp. Y6 TaxID=3418422 RepID=UPI003CF1723C